jgi:hypothetical protein
MKNEITGQEVLIDQPLYYSRLVASGFTGDLAFFKNVIGGTEDGLNLSDFETNNQFPGAVPEGERFDVHGFAVSIHDTTAVPYADARQIMELAKAVLIFRIAQVEWFKLPLFKFPSGHGLSAFSTESDVTTFTNGLPSPKSVVKLKKPIRLPTQRPFDVLIRFISAPTLSKTTRIFVFMEGTKKAPAFK